MTPVAALDRLKGAPGLSARHRQVLTEAGGALHSRHGSSHLAFGAVQALRALRWPQWVSPADVAEVAHALSVKAVEDAATNKIAPRRRRPAHQVHALRPVVALGLHGGVPTKRSPRRVRDRRPAGSWVTYAEAAERIGFTVAAVRAAVLAGHLERRVGIVAYARVPFVLEADVDAYSEAREADLLPAYGLTPSDRADRHRRHRLIRDQHRKAAGHRPLSSDDA